MLKNETNFDDFKNDVRLLLDSFIRTNETIAAIVELNDDLFRSMLVLEEAKTLNRIIGRFSPTEETCDLIEATLTLVAKQCKSDGSPAMAHEADALLERLSRFEAGIANDPPSCRAVN
jgi:hypothetical protein